MHNARIPIKFRAVIREVNKYSHNSSVTNVKVAKVNTVLKHRAEVPVEKPSAVMTLANVSKLSLPKMELSLLPSRM